MSGARLTWGGLDFDTYTLDAELLTVLAVLAPDDGHLAKVSLTARPDVVVGALVVDLEQVGRGPNQAGHLTAWGHADAAVRALVVAQRALEEADREVQRARRALGLVTS